MKILFISRAYPPITGGIENQNFALSEWLPKHASVTTLANHGGKANLPFFLPRALFQGLRLFRSHDAILLGDGVLAPLGFIFKLFYPHKVVASVLHGLDITFATKQGFLAKMYAFVNIPSLKKLDLLIAVSQETRETARKASIPEEKCLVINNGIDPAAVLRNSSRSELTELLGEDLSGKQVILRTGRYVEHKGVEWFIRSVVPALPDNVLFVAAGAVVKKKTPGDQDYLPLCQKAVSDLGLESRVKLLTDLPWEKMQILFNTADLVVSPNIPVPGTMEGFGISVLEAAICKRPVIASDLEGLKDAIHHNENGMLVPPKDKEAYIMAITSLLTNDEERLALGERAARYTEKHYHWQNIAKLYTDALASAQKKVQ